MTVAIIEYLAAGLAKPQRQIQKFPTRRKAYEWIDNITQAFHACGAKVIGYEVYREPRVH